MKNQNSIETINNSIHLNKVFGSFGKRQYFSNYASSLEIRPTDNVLEFGSEQASMANELIKKLSTGQLTCFDILTKNQTGLNDYSCITSVLDCFDSNKLVESKFDSINIHFALCEISELIRPKIVNELFDLLKPGGVVYVREPQDKKANYTSKEVHRIFRDAGFCPIFEETSKNHIVGEVFTACYKKISTIRFFLT